jgi:hypothetical protein
VDAAVDCETVLERCDHGVLCITGGGVPPPAVAAERWFEGLKDLLALVIPTGAIVYYIDTKSQLAAKDVEMLAKDVKILAKDIREGFSAMVDRVDTLIQDYKSDRNKFDESQRYSFSRH